jgi:uncharacterized protein (DUF2252 family)
MRPFRTRSPNRAVMVFFESAGPGGHMAMELTSVEDQQAAGKAARASTERTAAADWRPAADRVDPVAILSAQDDSRVPGLVPLRHGRMAVSPFTFYRGAAAIMAADLASLPVSGFDVQLCGDAHLSNLGVFAGPDRRLLFDLNDFDETLRGPWEWDLLRLATSFTIAARDSRLSPKDARTLTATTVRAYREAMASFAEIGPLDTWYSRLDTDDIRAAIAPRSKKGARSLDRGVEKARRRTSLQAASKLTESVDGNLRFRADPPVVVPLGSVSAGGAPEGLAAAVRANYDDYLTSLPDDRQALLGRFRMTDIAHKVVGVGSVGNRAFIVLFESDAGEPLILQFKEAGASVLEPYLGVSPYDHHGQRVVEGQRMMQAASDIFLGWSRSTLDGRDYYWRQLRDMKGSAVIEEMGVEALGVYAQTCGWSLARAHARSGHPAAISAYVGKGDQVDKAVSEFAARYADQNEADFRRHADAVATGDVPCEVER